MTNYYKYYKGDIFRDEYGKIYVNDVDGSGFIEVIVGRNTVGEVITSPSNPDSTKWLEMSGQWVNRADWPLLSAAIPSPQLDSEWAMDISTENSTTAMWTADGINFLLTSNTKKLRYGTPGNWQLSEANILPTNGPTSMTYDGTEWVYFSTSNIYHSATPLTSWSNPVALGFTPTSLVAARGIILASDAATNIKYSTDHGETWNALTWPMTGSSIWSRLAMTPTGFCIVAYYNHISGGEVKAKTVLDADLTTWSNAVSIVISPSGGPSLGTSTNPISHSTLGIMWQLDQFNTAYFSPDYGTTWKRISLPYGDTGNYPTLVPGTLSSPAFGVHSETATKGLFSVTYNGYNWTTPMSILRNGGSSVYAIMGARQTLIAGVPPATNNYCLGYSIYDASRIYLPAQSYIPYAGLKYFIKAA